MSIAVLGEALIDFIVGDDGAYRPYLGGSPYNVAIGLARQGIEVSYLSSLSDDSFGEQLRCALLDAGVHLPLTRRSLWPTSLALVTVNAEGQASYRLYREGIADKDTSYEEIVAHVPAGTTVFHTGSLAITPSQLPKIRKVFATLRERGVLVSVDINIRLRASIDEQRYLDGVRSLLPLADIVKASDEDIAAFGLDTDVRRSAERIYAEMSGGMLVLTEGSGGAILYSGEGRISKRSYPVASLVDTVGAGDTFHAAFLAYLSRNNCLPTVAWSSVANDEHKVAAPYLEQALDYACAAAAINVSRAGCSPPTDTEVTDFIAAAAR